MSGSKKGSSILPVEPVQNSSTCVANASTIETTRASDAEDRRRSTRSSSPNMKAPNVNEGDEDEDEDHNGGGYQSFTGRSPSIMPRRPSLRVAPAKPKLLTRTTSVKMQYPMWVMPVSTFLAQDKNWGCFEPHQDLLESGKLVLVTPDMIDKIIFVSHEWLSFDHPDPDGTQHSALHHALTRLAAGEVKEVRGTRIAEQFLGQKMVVKAEGWKRMLPQMFIWLDYMSIPQPTVEKARTGPDAAERIEKAEGGLKLAVASIPSYIEWTALMLILVPSLQHQSVKGTVCGFDTWRMRGWCRLEFLGTFLARNKIRVMVVKGQGARPKFVAPYEAMILHPLGGEFTCCQRNHISTAGKSIPCDKHSVKKVLRSMIKAKVEHARRHDDVETLFDLRYWICTQDWYLHGLGTTGKRVDVADAEGSFFPIHNSGGKEQDEDEDGDADEEKNDKDNSSSAVEALVQRLKWTPLHAAVGKSSGFTLLVYAVLSDDLEAVTEILEQGEHDVNQQIAAHHPNINVGKGMLPLSLAMMFASFPIVAALLDAGSKHIDGLGRSVLFYACCFGRKDLVAQWLKRFPSFDLEQSFRGGAGALGVSLRFQVSPLPTVQVLMAAGASPTFVAGGKIATNALITAAHNDQASGDLMRAMAEMDEINVNAANSPATRRVAAYAALAKAARRVGIKLPKSKFLLHFIGATALHFAASKGNGNSTKALLSLGADPHIRNGLGQTPFQCAEAAFGKGQVPEAITSLFRAARATGKEDRTGSGRSSGSWVSRIGTCRIGSGRTGSGRTGSGRTSSGRTGSGGKRAVA